MEMSGIHTLAIRISSSNSNSNSNSTRHEEEIYMDRNVFGPCCDPIAQLWIFASWPRFPEGAFVENHDSHYNSTLPRHSPGSFQKVPLRLQV